MANFTSDQNQNYFTDTVTFTAGTPTFNLVDIVNDGSRPNYEQVVSHVDASYQKTSTEVSIRHTWVGNMGAYVYDFEYFVDPEAVKNLNVISLQIEIFAEQPNASLASNTTTKTAFEQAQSHNPDATQENLSSDNVALMTFETPLYQGNNFAGSQTSIVYEGNFVEGRDGDGKFKLSQHTRESTVKTKRKRVLFAKPYVTDDNQDLATMYYGSPDYVEPTTHPFGTPDPDQPLDPIEIADSILGEDFGLDDEEEISGSEIDTLTDDSPGTLDPFRRVDPGDLIALNNIVQRISLREARESIKMSRRTMASARNKKLTKALVAQVSPPSQGHGGILGYAGELETNVHTVHMEVEIPKFLLESRLPQSLDADTFFVKVTPIIGASAQKGTSPAPVVFSVSHRSQVAELLKPVFPPEIKIVTTATDEFIVAVRGVDPTTKYVTFSYRVQRPPGSNAPAGDNVKISLFSDHGFLNQQLNFASDPLSFHNFALKTSGFSIPAIAPNTMVIRATANAGAGLSIYEGKYAEISVECPPGAHTPMQIPHVAISAVNYREHIVITVSNIPDSVSAIRLLREEIDESGGLAERSKVVPYKDGRKTVPVESSLVYSDYETDSHRRYRYYCIMTVRRPGSIITYEQVSASDDIVQRVKPPVQPPFEPEITAADTTVLGDSSVGVSIALTISSKPDSVNLLVSLLEKAGVNQAFVESIEKQVESPSGFQDLVAFLGTRIDLHTGEHEYLGIITPGLFVDNKSTQAIANRQPLYAGREYQYVFQLTTRPATSFLTKVEQFLKGKKVPGNPNMKVQAKKFLSVYSSVFGAIPSESDLDNQSVASQFELGYTGITLARKFIMPELPLKVADVSVEYKDKNKNRALIKWKIKGNFKQRSNVDGFRIYVTYRDQTSICGKLDAHPKFSEYSFDEEKYAEQVGDKLYFIVPIMLPGGKQGNPSKKAKLTKSHSIPDALLLPKLKFDFLGLTKIKEGAFKKVGQTPLILNKNALGPTTAISPKKSGLQQSFEIETPTNAKPATNPTPNPGTGNKQKKDKFGPTF